MAELKFLNLSRGRLRASVTTKYNSLETLVQGKNCAELKALLVSVKELGSKIEVSNEKIGILSCEDKNFDAEVEFSKCDEYQEKLEHICAFIEGAMQDLIDQDINTSSISANAPNNVQSLNRLNIPDIPLPKFGNRAGEHVESFLNSFEKVSRRFNLDPVERFLLFKGQLHGSAYTMVKHERDYESAVKTLKDAFGDPVSQKFDTIRDLSKLQLSQKGDVYEFIGEMRAIIHMFSSLKIEIDDILQYFVWHSMPESLRNQLVSITNCNKPSLTEIEQHIFKAAERFQTANKLFLSSKSTPVGFSSTSMAVNIQYDGKARKCIFCSNDGADAQHGISKCPKYVTPKEKFEKLKRLDACVRCTALSHKSDTCKFNFNKSCYFCKKNNHFSFLCLSKDKVRYSGDQGQNKSGASNKNGNGVENLKNTTQKLNQMTVSFDQNSSKFISNSIFLPTFTAKTHSGMTVRVLKDSGSQASFCSEKLFRQENFEILSDLDINVNGINVCQRHKSKLVQIPLKLNGKIYCIKAVVVPSIDINLKIPGFSKIYHEFLNKGYNFADRLLAEKTNTISDVSVILGSQSMHCIPEHSVVFGTFNDSIFSQTEGGIMLYGSIENISANLRFLPNFSPEQLPASVSSLQPVVEGPSEAVTKPVTAHTGSPVGSTYGRIGEGDIHGRSMTLFTNFCVLDRHGAIDEVALDNATKSTVFESDYRKLESNCGKYLGYIEDSNDEVSINDEALIDYALSNMERSDDGRLKIKILWNPDNAHRLGTNFNLAKGVLLSSAKKLRNDKGKLLMVDKVFKAQLESGIIKEIPNLTEFMQNNEYSFLGHMPVFRLDKESTKTRVVFLANINDKKENNALSHNNTIETGANLNKRMAICLMQLRFGKKLLAFDLVKAYNMIDLFPEDMKKLAFLWFKDVENGNYEIVGYMNCRVPFGLRNSCFLLMICIYRILIVDGLDETDSFLHNLRKKLWDLAYVDNLAVSYDSSEDLARAYEALESIFSPYKFGLQQFVTNDVELQAKIDKDNEICTKVKNNLLGVIFDRKKDTMAARKICLNKDASTKRLILHEIASCYDLLGITTPLLSRPRLFLHRLSLDRSLGWDDEISQSQQHEWSNICKQANRSKEVAIPRFLGGISEEYILTVYTDSSSSILGCVIYIEEVSSGRKNFLMGKNHVISASMESKTMPCLELQAIALGVEAVIDIYQELCGPSCVNPINIKDIHLFSDSLVCIHWLVNYAAKYEKMNKQSIFVMNRLKSIRKLCDVHPILFQYCAGPNNPADNITRCMGYAKFIHTNYLSGRTNFDNSSFPKVRIPGEFLTENVPCVESMNAICDNDRNELLYDQKRRSKFKSMIEVYKQILIASNKFKMLVMRKNPGKQYKTLSDEEIERLAFRKLILDHQNEFFGDIIEYFQKDRCAKRDIPVLVTKYNIFPNENGILKVRAKIKSWNIRRQFPILIARKSHLMTAIVRSKHSDLLHGPFSALLAEIRRNYFIPSIYSAVKSVVKDCVWCNGQNNRTIPVNTNAYRDFRLEPPEIPFRFCFCDYAGPFFVMQNGSKSKIYVLLLMCLWSRGVSLQICEDKTVQKFIRAIQLHIYDFGVMERCYSDWGSQIVPGSEAIVKILQDRDTQEYFREHNIESLSFDQYSPECSKLGGLVESGVKIVKKLIYGSIRNLVLQRQDFEFMIAQVRHYANRRPIAFSEYLGQDAILSEIPSVITPEILINGRELVSVNVLPDVEVSEDPDWLPRSEINAHVRSSLEKLTKARGYLSSLYHEELLAKLMHQSTDRKDRFKPVKHVKLHKNDIVLIKQKHIKRSNWPMAIVVDTVVNDLGEVTDATVKKGKTGECVKRHVDFLVPILKTGQNNEEASMSPNNPHPSPAGSKQRSKSSRKAAKKCQEGWRSLASRNLV